MDIGNARLVARLLVLPSLLLTFAVALVLSAFLPTWLAVVLAFVVVGPGVHFLVGGMLERRPERWGQTGAAITVSGFAYPVVAWLGGTVYVAATRSWALAVLVFVSPVVLLVAAALVSGNSNRRPLRAAAGERRAIAAERGWSFVEDGTDVLAAHWSAQDSTFDVTASSVLVGEIGGWPVTICDVVARRRHNENRTICCLVHLPVALPQTVALPVARPSVVEGEGDLEGVAGLEGVGQEVEGEVGVAGFEADGGVGAEGDRVGVVVVEAAAGVEVAEVAGLVVGVVVGVDDGGPAGDLRVDVGAGELVGGGGGDGGVDGGGAAVADGGGPGVGDGGRVSGAASAAAAEADSGDGDGDGDGERHHGGSRRRALCPVGRWEGVGGQGRLGGWFSVGRRRRGAGGCGG